MTFFSEFQIYIYKRVLNYDFIITLYITRPNLFQTGSSIKSDIDCWQEKFCHSAKNNEFDVMI